MPRKFLLILLFFTLTCLPALSAPWMIGELSSYSPEKGLLTLILEDGSLRDFLVTERTVCDSQGKVCKPEQLPKGKDFGVVIEGSLGAKPLKAKEVSDDLERLRNQSTYRTCEGGWGPCPEHHKHSK
jgi:hypothetical protein